jgi:hypothetical protein
VLHNNPGTFAGLSVLLVVVGIVTAVALAGVLPARTRAVLLGTALAVLLIAPASWSVQTLGHATSGTFPAGGPASASFGGGPGGGAPRFFPPGGPPPGAPGRGNGVGPAVPAGAPPGGGGPFGSSAGLSEVASYVRTHGGGTIGVSSQTGASSQIISSGARVAGLGGFSGRESEVSVSWLADAVQSGRIRWVLVDGSGGRGFGPGADGRVGASRLMAAVRRAGTKAMTTTGGTLYDLAGRASALRAAAS